MTSTSSRLRGQSAFEFMFIFGLFVVVLLVGLMVSWTKVYEVKQYQRSMETDDALNMIAGKLNTAWIEGEGFSTNLTMPQKIASSEYQIRISSNLLMLNVSGLLYIKPLITQNISGNLTKGAVNTLTNMGDHIKIS